MLDFLQPANLSQQGLPTLRDWAENDWQTNLFLVITCIVLVCIAGTMSGLTLGLMSLGELTGLAWRGRGGWLRDRQMGRERERE